ncbi:MAG TPA: PQQ-binding-like beta-propeller repeat protein [Pirellulaceae bacterium]|jgi:outer membrane protein assembly factor BamB|nr:PQQ-binding-like beta-propeller repeat protein [Pirellulaceae bacterium]
MLRYVTCFAIYFAATLGSASVAFAQKGREWPQFLGPNRDGISTETGLIDGWPKEGLEEVWRVDAGGIGMSGIAISGDRMLTMIQAEGQQHILCLDAETGKRIWLAPIAKEYLNPQGDGPRATPTVAGGQVFAYTGQGILVALRLEDGKILWSRDCVKELGGEPAEYGMACSPLVVGKHVVVTVGAPKATVAAYDVASGEPVWQTGEGEAPGYSSPALLDVGGQKQIVAFTGAAAHGLAPVDGKLLWSYPFKTDYACNTASPIAVDGKVFISAGENHGSALLKLTPRADGFEAAEVWSSYGPESVLRSEWQTSVLIDGCLYGFDNVGGAGPVTHLTCVNASTGEQAWQEVRFGKGNLIAADGKLLISTMKGELVLVEASPKAFREIGRQKVLSPTRQAPSIASGLVYLRDDREIVCVSLRKK